MNNLKSISFVMLLCWAMSLIGGCAQAIHTKKPVVFKGSNEVHYEHTLKINTLLKTVIGDGFYYDPDGFVGLRKYQGIPAEFEIEYNPLTGIGTFKVKAETK